MNWKAILGGLGVLWLIALTWALVSLGGAGERVDETGASEQSTSDSSASDSDTSDAGTSDAGTSDAGTSDAGTSDAGTGQAVTSQAPGSQAPDQKDLERVAQAPPAEVDPPAEVVASAPLSVDPANAAAADAPPASEESIPVDLEDARSDAPESSEPDAFRRRMLREIFDPLEEAAERYDRHDELDKRSLFGADQKSNQKAIDELLDEAIEILGLSEVGSVREQIRELEAKIAGAEQRLSRDREARLSAPFESELNAIEKTLTTSREDYDERIEENETLVADTEVAIVELKQQFRQELRDIGVELSTEAIEGLLTTVSGDDFVEMCVVFDNVRNVTVQLQELTGEAGEALDVARRYYGSYVVLVRIMDRLQKEFVRRVSDEQLPRLKEFQVKARENIAQAQRNLADGGDPEIAQANIRSNQLTIDACELYSEYLVEQAREVNAQNDALQKRLRDAINTYETVQLSSQVAELLAEGQRNFSALLELDLPELRGFENAELQAEFQRLTRELVQP